MKRTYGSSIQEENCQAHQNGRLECLESQDRHRQDQGIRRHHSAVRLWAAGILVREIDTRVKIQLVQLTAMSAFHAGGEEAINSSIADESSSSYAFAISLISTNPCETDPEQKRNSQSLRILL